MAVANKYQGQPIAFIAINSGNSSVDVAKYLDKNHVTWPTIVDTDRLFETAAGVGEISLQNIWQFRTIDANGELKRLGSDLEADIEKVLSTAAWNVDPTIIPDSLKESWFAIEFGNYPVAARTVTRSLKNKKTDISSAAQTLYDFVETKQQEKLAIAKSAESANEPWLAYKSYSEIKMQFEGYEFDIELNVESILNELAKNETVVKELAAQKLFDVAMKQMARSGAARVAGRLKKLSEEYPTTEAGIAAQKLLGPDNR